MIPGTSRSGATIVGALLLGVSRTAAAEFTFFLAVPSMLAASAFKLLKFGFSFTSSELLVLIIGMAVAFIVSIFVIKFLMSFIKKHDFKAFGWYRITNSAENQKRNISETDVGTSVSEMFHSPQKADKPYGNGLLIHTITTNDKVLKYNSETNNSPFDTQPIVTQGETNRFINLYIAA